MPRKKKDVALDLVDTLISNEKKDKKPRRKPGRPKGSKNKPSKQKSKKTEVVKESKPLKKAETTSFEQKFVTPEQFEELGRPRWGYTTARIRQWKNKTAGYFEVLLEYERAAILWSRLVRAIEWYSTVDEYKLSLCRKEIKHFREVNNLTEHDLNEVIAIAHRHIHKRKKMLKALKETAKVVLENRKRKAETEEERKAINYREVVRIPPNVRPTLKYVKVDESSIEDDVKGAVSELTGNPQVISEHACPDHINYQGLRKPRNYCPTCLYFYKHNKKLGLKEKRNR